ncbi:MAG: hypothetical protein WHT06_03495 [Desulfobacterales bacterium]
MKTLFRSIFTVLFFFSVSTAQDEPLGLSAFFDKPEYRVGEPIKLTLTFLNRSSETVYLRVAASQIRIASNGEILFKRKGFAGARADFNELQPGESRPWTLEFSPESFLMPPAGRHTVTITYTNTQREWGADGGARTQRRTMAYKLWTGKIKTTAPLKIVD